MARLSEDKRLHAIGMLQTGMSQKEVAPNFGGPQNQHFGEDFNNMATPATCHVQVVHA